MKRAALFFIFLDLLTLTLSGCGVLEARYNATAAQAAAKSSAAYAQAETAGAAAHGTILAWDPALTMLAVAL